MAESTGSDVMKRMAAPMFGGLLTSFAMELLIYPVIFPAAKQFQIRRRQGPQQKTVTWQDWVVGHLTDTEAVTVRVECRGIVGGGINRQERFWDAAMDF